MDSYRAFVALLTASRIAHEERSRIPRRQFGKAITPERKRRLALYPMPTVIIDLSVGEREAYLDPVDLVFVVDQDDRNERWTLEEVRGFRPSEASGRSLRNQALVNDGFAARAGQPDHDGAQG